MKKFLCIFLIIMFSTNLMAQFNYDPYAGYKMGYGQGCYDRGVTLLCEGEYDKALLCFKEGIEYTANNWGGLGLCYELGLGTQKNYVEAYKCYTKGANKGDQTSKIALQRIAQDGYMSEEKGEIFLENIRAIQNARTQNFINNGGGNIGGGNIGTYNSGGNSSSGSTYTTCRICGGSGTCTSCGGRGGEWRDTGYYTGSNVKSWINCGSCKGNGRCFNCHGRGKY